MAMVNFLAFAVLKILNNLSSMQNYRKISQTVQRDLIFILNVPSESSIHFALLSIVLAKKECC